MKIKFLLYLCKKSNLFARFILSWASNLLIAIPYLFYLFALVVSAIFVFPPVMMVKHAGWGPVSMFLGWGLANGIFICWILIKCITYFSFKEDITSTVYIFRKKLNEFLKEAFQNDALLRKFEGIPFDYSIKALARRYRAERKAHIEYALDKAIAYYGEKEGLIQLEKLKENKRAMGL